MLTSFQVSIKFETRLKNVSAEKLTPVSDMLVLFVWVAIFYDFFLNCIIFLEISVYIDKLALYLVNSDGKFKIKPNKEFYFVLKF